MSQKTLHQLQVEQFMYFAKQELPSKPTVPSEGIRALRARLILEEALETIEALGFDAVQVRPGKIEMRELGFSARRDPNLIEIIDGCCDIAVVTTGTLSACGVPDHPFQDEVNKNNLAKFGPGHSIREDGKLIKPPNHQPPNIAGVLERICSADKFDNQVCTD